MEGPVGLPGFLQALHDRIEHAGGPTSIQIAEAGGHVEGWELPIVRDRVLLNNALRQLPSSLGLGTLHKLMGTKRLATWQAALSSKHSRSCFLKSPLLR